jgi:O-antigen/teichoic acid export membrane protein
MYLGLIGSIKQSSFLKHNAIFFFGSLAVGALNYAYYPVLGRLMEPSAFGEVQVLVSLFLQFTIFLNVLSTITVNITANYSDQAKAHRVIFELEKLASYIAAGILLISIVGGEFLRQQLHFTSIAPFVALALAILVSIPLTFRSAYARGQKRFGIASVSQLIGAGIKIIFSAGLVIFGLGATGAIGGIVIAQFIAFLYAARWAARIGFSRPSDTNYKTVLDIKVIAPELKYASIVFVGLFSVTLLMSIDVIVVKYYFDAHTAGLYAGIATVARIIFFLVTPIAQVLMPLIKLEQTPHKNHQLLLKSLGLTLLVGGSMTVLCIAFPHLLIALLMGHAYDAYAGLLPLLSTTILVVSVINLITMYYLSLRRKMVAVIGIIGIAVTVSLMLIWHANLFEIVNSMFWGSTFTLGALLVYVLVSVKRGVLDGGQNDLNRHSDL